ncbi:MAG: hypothetical protein VX112_03845 [Pseudomonadota bacterium]|nr:hypothetical protein [Pseudomonadota bacterium]
MIWSCCTFRYTFCFAAILLLVGCSQEASQGYEAKSKLISGEKHLAVKNEVVTKDACLNSCNRFFDQSVIQCGDYRNSCLLEVRSGGIASSFSESGVVKTGARTAYVDDIIDPIRLHRLGFCQKNQTLCIESAQEDKLRCRSDCELK